MPWRHRDDQAFGFALNNTIKSTRYTAMMLAYQHFGPYVFSEVYESGSGPFSRLKGQEPQLKPQAFGFYIMIVVQEMSRGFEKIKYTPGVCVFQEEGGVSRGTCF